MPTCEVLIGLPATGKSTLVKKLKNPKSWVYSTDAYIELAAMVKGKTYDEVFKEEINTATSDANEYLTNAIAIRADVIWDQTNLTEKKRKKIINRMKSFGYEVNAHYIHSPHEVDDIIEWQDRLASRQGKTIPNEVMRNMCTSFTAPNLDEGFSSIMHYNIYGEVNGVEISKTK